MHTIPVDLPNECVPLATCKGCFLLAVDLHSGVRQYQPWWCRVNIEVNKWLISSMTPLLKGNMGSGLQVIDMSD